MKRILFIAMGALLLSCGNIFFAHAQSAPIDLTLTSVPLNPQPQQQITITAQSYSTDISQALMTWTYNGKVISSNTGQTTIAVIAPAGGTTGTIIATATGAGFDQTSATLLLRPASIDLLWEGVGSYAPPFYKGRALPSIGSIIKVTAVPAYNAPRQLSYSWTQNGDAQTANSGYNKTSYLFQNSALISTEQIGVTEQSGGFSAQNSVAITPINPTVIGYFNTDGYIDYANGGTSSLSTTASGAIVHFEPYFFSTPYSIPHDLSFAYADSTGNTLDTGDPENELRLSRPDEGGQSQLSLMISTIEYSLQNLTQKFSVNFN